MPGTPLVPIFFSFSCSFQETLTKIVCWSPDLCVGGPYPRYPGSATALTNQTLRTVDRPLHCDLRLVSFEQTSMFYILGVWVIRVLKWTDGTAPHRTTNLTNKQTNKQTDIQTTKCHPDILAMCQKLSFRTLQEHQRIRTNAIYQKILIWPL